MNDTLKISTVIITKNEEYNINRCISSAIELSDEVLVVDSFSKDNTVAIAEKLGAKVLTNEFVGHIEQKNFAIRQAKNDIILSLDADEELSSELKKNISSLVMNNPSIFAVRFKRKTFYLGKWINHSGWYPDKKIRLFNRKYARWGGYNPHDKIILQDICSVIDLEGNLLHYSYKNINDHINKIKNYASVAAQYKYDNDHKCYRVVHLLLYPIWVFINTYFFKRGFMDGPQGFTISRYNAYYRYLKYKKLFELRGF